MSFRGCRILMVLIPVAVAGCHTTKITAIPLSPWNCQEPEGIPYYLPKPLLVVSKNFYHVEDGKVGLTDSAPIPSAFDDQAKYADVNARSTFVSTHGTNPANITINDQSGNVTIEGASPQGP